MTNNQAVFRSEDARRRILELYDAELKRWDFPFRSRMIETRFGGTSVIETGDATMSGEPVVLLHGSGGNALTWGADIPVLAKTRRVCAVDILGEPGKSTGDRIDWDGQSHAEWLDDLLSRLGYGRVVLAGISYGGWIALNYACRYPEKTARLALVCPAGLVAPKASYLFRLIAFMMLGEPGKKKLKRMFFGRTELPPALEEFFEICGKSFNYRMGSPPVLTDDQVRALTMPVYYLAGARDQVFDSARAAARLSALASHATVRLIEGQTHVFTETASELHSFIG